MDDVNLNRKLIDIISGLPLLYNQYHPDKKNKHKTESAWKEVAEKMNCTVQFCLMRWNNIRSTYARKHKKSTEVPSGSASQAPETWPYFKQLHFLDSYIKHRRYSQNFYHLAVN
ncbi:transcription factor Adf-1-like [Ciona intestinalis]